MLCWRICCITLVLSGCQLVTDFDRDKILHDAGVDATEDITSNDANTADAND